MGKESVFVFKPLLPVRIPFISFFFLSILNNWFYIIWRRQKQQQQICLHLFSSFSIFPFLINKRWYTVLNDRAKSEKKRRQLPPFEFFLFLFSAVVANFFFVLFLLKLESAEWWVSCDWDGNGVATKEERKRKRWIWVGRWQLIDYHQAIIYLQTE